MKKICKLTKKICQLIKMYAFFVFFCFFLSVLFDNLFAFFLRLLFWWSWCLQITWNKCKTITRRHVWMSKNWNVKIAKKLATMKGPTNPPLLSTKSKYILFLNIQSTFFNFFIKNIAKIERPDPFFRFFFRWNWWLWITLEK